MGHREGDLWMKYVILLGDGMSDWPLPELGDKTPLQAAHTPHMDGLARDGKTGQAWTIPEGMSTGSDVAALTILGYDTRNLYTGRSPLEAASIGIDLQPTDVAFRCNMVVLGEVGGERTMADFSGGHITTEEASRLIDTLNAELGGDRFRFYPGVSYRHCLVWHDGQLGSKLTPPHDITGRAIAEYLPSGDGAAILQQLMDASQRIFREHPVNRQRRDHGEAPITSIWLWGAGKRPQIPSFRDKYGLTGGVISAVDLHKGLAIYAGLDPISVPGATGWLDTNYAGKVDYALKALRDKDFVFLHVEAPDEAGHQGDVQAKVQAIEDFDAKVVGPMLAGLRRDFDTFRVLLLPDHPTPLALKTHVREPVPIALYGTGVEPDAGESFDETVREKGSLDVQHGTELMRLLLSGKC
jgi:2,3-bisphosphoglycerate-independent phosphoglycerate mutase